MRIKHTLQKSKSMNDIFAMQKLSPKKYSLTKNKSLLPEHSKIQEIKALNNKNFIALSNKLRKITGLKNIESLKDSPPYCETNDLIHTSRKTVEAFLNTNIDFKLTGCKGDSGVIALKILQQENPELSEKEIILKNIDSLSLDSCMSVVSSGTYLTEDLKIKYEDNKLSEITIESQNIISSFLPYGIDIFRSYFDKHPDLHPQRPRLNFTVPVHSLPLEDMPKEIQNNLIEAWTKRNENPFKQALENFFIKIKTEHNIDLSKQEKDDDIKTVWQNIIHTDNTHYTISKALFEALGGDWSKSESITDEEKTFRQFPSQKWHINPFGKKYRQHRTGRGALMPLAPSEDALQIAEAEIQKNRKPFINHEDMMAILKKIDNPVDRFALHTLFMNQPVEASISGTAIRMMNLWEKIRCEERKKPEDERKSLPSMRDMEKLLYVYMVGEKAHHSSIDIHLTLRNRRPNIE